MIGIGELFPNFQANTTRGNIQFYDWMAESWCLFLSVNSNFKSVCTTELSALMQMQHEFERRNVKVIALSCNSTESLDQWIVDIKCHAKFHPKATLPYPIIADERRDLGIELNIIEENIHDSYGVPLTSRATFIIDPFKNLQFSSIQPERVGRNFHEVLRVIDALQLISKHQVATPANWKVGQPVMLSSNIPNKTLSNRYPDAIITHMPSGKSSIKQIPQPLN